MEVVLKNLKPNTTYTVRPYYTTWLGTFYPKQYAFNTGENGNETPSGDYGIEMVYVQGGIFMMGNNVGGDSDESPVHMVTLSDFYIGKTEVTQAQWKAVMGNNQSLFIGDDLPAERVSWNDVQLFLKRLNQLTGKQYRLPTEAEWEYAARGGQKSKAYKYAGSDNIDQVAWWEGNSDGKTHLVATKAPNELGLYDMTGNVWEWCNDFYANNYYINSPDTNPTGPDTGNGRVLRGGSYGVPAKECRSTNRNKGNPDSREPFLGFRLVHPQ
ncbi:sulfatase-modifying factor protein [Porphyromonas gingivalis]|nr:sulfatase-modifying factor protein [Porphyromonas gingivalis]